MEPCGQLKDTSTRISSSNNRTPIVVLLKSTSLPSALLRRTDFAARKTLNSCFTEWQRAT